MLVVEIIRDAERQAADLPDSMRASVRSAVMSVIDTQAELETNPMARRIFHDAVTAFIADRKRLVEYRLIRQLFEDLRGPR